MILITDRPGWRLLFLKYEHLMNNLPTPRSPQSPLFSRLGLSSFDVLVHVGGIPIRKCLAMAFFGGPGCIEAFH
jgi:hypothetical protein